MEAASEATPASSKGKKSLKESRSEDYGYRNLIGGSWRRDLPPDQYFKHLRVCANLWRENPVAKKGAQNFRAFVAAEGFQVKSTCGDLGKRKILQRLLDEHFRNNNWTLKLGQRIETLAVEGEWNYLVGQPNPFTGHIRIHKINPEAIAGIASHPLDAETMERAKLIKALVEQVSDEMGCLAELNHEELRIVHRCPVSGRLRGNLLHLAINQLAGQTRGWSDLMVVADYLDSLDLMVIGEVDRQRMMKVFAWIVKLNSAAPGALQKRKEELRLEGPPNPGDLLITDGSEEWDTKTPMLNTQETIAFFEFLLMLVMGGLNLPQHWFSQGGDVNKATAGEMGAPVMAQVRDRKKLVMEFMLWCGELALFAMLDSGKLLAHDITASDLTLEVLSQDPERKYYQAVGKMLEELGTALELAQRNQWITPVDASAKFKQAAQALGLGEFEAASLQQARQVVAESLAKQPTREGYLSTSNSEFASLW